MVQRIQQLALEGKYFQKEEIIAQLINGTLKNKPRLWFLIRFIFLVGTVSFFLRWIRYLISSFY